MYVCARQGESVVGMRPALLPHRLVSSIAIVRCRNSRTRTSRALPKTFKLCVPPPISGTDATKASLNIPNVRIAIDSRISN